MSEKTIDNTKTAGLLTGKIKPLYFKYLTAAFGSALISSIYGVVDMAMVGQYEGPNGTAALAVVSPIWNIIYSLGLLMGIGGSVLFSTLRGESEQNRKRSNEYFTASLIGTAILAVITWVAVIFFDRGLLMLFGAEETLLPLARRYLFPVKFAVPSFLLTQLMAAFLRNDGNPGLATKAVLFGGIFNVFGDWFFVFALDMGVMGAGLATVMGSVFSLIIMLTHFFGKRNTLRLERPSKLFSMLKSISLTGFSTFFIDVAMGILTVLFNRQILKYLGTDALSVYGIIINISTFVQCCAYSIGQASQPIISANFGAHHGKRIREILKYALATAAVFGLVWTAMAEFVPNLFVRIFMTPTDGILKIAPAIIRSYGISFLLLPVQYLFNILFPGRHEAGCFLYRIGVKGSRDQRYSDLPSAGDFRSGQHLVCHAPDGTDRCGFCGGDDDSLYKTSVKKGGRKSVLPPKNYPQMKFSFPAPASKWHLTMPRSTLE